MNKQQIIAALTAKGIQFNANDSVAKLQALLDASNASNASNPVVAQIGERNKALASIGKGIVDIPVDTYTLKEFAGVSASGMRKAKYENSKGIPVTFYGIDGYEELWEQDGKQLKEKLTFGFDATAKKITTGAGALSLA